MVINGFDVFFYSMLICVVHH